MNSGPEGIGYSHSIESYQGQSLLYVPSDLFPREDWERIITRQTLSQTPKTMMILGDDKQKKDLIHPEEFKEVASRPGSETFRWIRRVTGTSISSRAVVFMSATQYESIDQLMKEVFPPDLLPDRHNPIFENDVA